MFRHLDIKLVVIASLGAAAFGLVVLLQNFGLNNVPDENIVYVNPAVGGIEDTRRTNTEAGGSENTESETDEIEASATESD